MAESLSLFIMFVYMSSVLLHLPIAASQSLHKCHEEEKSALLEIKRSLKEGPEYCYYKFFSPGDYKKLESWKPEEGQEGGNCCTWRGVQCDRHSGHVMRLNLGQIPSFFGTLTQLSELRLNDNRLTGQIPSLLGNLSQLSLLNLSHNQLTGQIPSSLGNLTRISTINLWHNQLTGEIPDSLITLRQLKSLYLCSNKLTGPIPSQLGSLIHLENLDLSWNGLHGPVPTSISHLSNLMYLDLCVNNLNGDLHLGMFSGLKRLKTLVLSFNDFSLLLEPNASESYPLLWALGTGSGKEQLQRCDSTMFEQLEQPFDGI
ncbi:hypothetical protein CRG98_040990 [Punica granatum]|uniref:Uncharacterized protein n=1 Tax=Punica granatum TaxID=22663 RepID=A0A2I0I3P4_PUNGR|nr:hypothetical protein CRG98_040990 [Punica granatum]